MYKVRPRMLAGAIALGLTAFAPSAAAISAADAAAPPCQLFADAPIWDGSKWLVGEGGRINCSSTRTVTVRIRQDRPWWPDRTLAQVTKTGSSVILNARRYCTGNDDMKVFTETLTNTGGKVQSGRVLISC